MDKCPCCKKTKKEYEKENLKGSELFQEIEGTFLVRNNNYYHPSTNRISLYGCNNCGTIVFMI